MALVIARNTLDDKHISKLVINRNRSFVELDEIKSQWREAFGYPVEPFKMSPRQLSRLEESNYDIRNQRSIAARMLLRSNINEIIEDWNEKPAYVYTRRMLDEIYRQHPELEAGIDDLEDALRYRYPGIYCFPYTQANHLALGSEEAIVEQILEEETDYLTLANGLDDVSHRDLLKQCYRSIGYAYPRFWATITRKVHELG